MPEPFKVLNDGFVFNTAIGQMIITVDELEIEINGISVRQYQTFKTAKVEQPCGLNQGMNISSLFTN